MSNTVPSFPPVVLDEARHDEDVLVIYSKHPVHGWLRATYDPRQVDVARAEVLLRVSLGRRWDRPVGVVVTVSTELHIVPLPEGEPLRVVQLDAGRSRVEVDTDQVDDEAVLRALRAWQAVKGDEMRDCGARKPGWENGPAIGRHRIPCVRTAGHDGVHRDGLGQTWAGAQA